VGFGGLPVQAAHERRCLKTVSDNSEYRSGGILEPVRPGLHYGVREDLAGPGLTAPWPVSRSPISPSRC
jgi:hypothetical protein